MTIINAEGKLAIDKTKPKKDKPKVQQLDWRTQAAELITLNPGPTAQTYLDRGMDALETVWDTTYPLEGKTEEERDKQARRQEVRKQHFTVIAAACAQASKMEGTPLIRANKIVGAFIKRKILDVLLLFIESIVKRVAVSAYFEHRRYEAGTAVNPDVALANLERMRECHALNGQVLEGEDGEEMFAAAFNAVHDRGEETAEGEDHARDPQSANDAVPIAATSAEDAELAAYAIQQWASAYWRLMTNNKEQADVLPFAIERVEPGVYRNYTNFLDFSNYRTESYNARLQREKTAGLEALESVAAKMASDGFNLPA